MEDFELVGYKDETVRETSATPREQLSRFLFNTAKLDNKATAKLYYHDPTARSEILEALVLTYGERLGQDGLSLMVRDAEVSHILLQLANNEPQVGLLYQYIDARRG